MCMVYDPLVIIFAAHTGCSTPCLCEPGTVSMDLQEIMDDTIELPLYVHLSISSQGKTIQPQGMSDVGEHGLRCPDPLAVYESPQRGVNLVLHLLSVGFLPLFHLARKVVNLPGFSSIRVP